MKDKRLLKSSSNRMISGVCGGIGEFFGIDPTVIRLIWAILTFCGLGSGILIYIIAAVVIPEY
ncbi:MAG: PspC domain-containing protein [Lachnospiraceae bacterium]|jgi:phage shock protein C|nr:PspC domain-containing protein [Lachnospiraceae bacterium]MCI9601140.1 PspC domain-containing protein [Lachnospiraceae bacterium]MDE6895875.1 PspC domain-containing protein [Lachnospiraceae bacterium]MDE7320491.1 PspC domain-containing protein [Lachnospiraceae bacterium]